MLIITKTATETFSLPKTLLINSWFAYLISFFRNQKVSAETFTAASAAKHVVDALRPI